MTASALGQSLDGIAGLNMNHLPEYASLIMALHTAALIIVNLTPTPEDNEALGATGSLIVKLYRALEIVAGIVTPLAKR
jgi:hypothetical protein